MKKYFQSIEIDMNKIRKSINEDIASEMKEKGYEVVFSERTLQVKSVKPIADNKKTDKVKTKFDLLKADLLKRYNLKISFTESYRLRCINLNDLFPIVRNSTEQTTPSSDINQAEQAA